MHIILAPILLTSASFSATAQTLTPDADQNGYYYPVVTSSEAFKRELIRAGV